MLPMDSAAADTISQMEVTQFALAAGGLTETFFEFPPPPPHCQSQSIVDDLEAKVVARPRPATSPHTLLDLASLTERPP